MAFYITTPLYYVNDRPHLGTAYCTIVTDTLHRYHELFGEEVLFLTGTDEHGLKCQQAAEKRGLTPQAHCDDMVKNYRETWKELNIAFDIFFRTTDAFHVKAVQDCLQQLFDKNEIYSAEYEGWYSVSEEIFYTEKDLVDGKSPTGREVTFVKEKNYFFKMSKYQDQLIKHIQSHPDFILPDYRKNEILGFLRQPLEDLCISRPKSRLSWGIEIPFDKDYVTYVWFDALLNYATGVGFRQEPRKSEYEKWWVQSGAHHMLGKDILTTHAVYWTTMLMALGAPLPKSIFATGWILNKDSGKMSKSQGDVISPVDLKNKLGLDNLRYVLVRDIHLGNDAPFSLELAQSRVNTDLANNLGNLLSRTSQLIGKYFDGRMPGFTTEDDASRVLKSASLGLATEVKSLVNAMKPSYAIEKVMNVLTLANRYLEEKAPWKLAKEDLASAGHVLATALETVRISTILLTPVIPGKAQEILSRLDVTDTSFEAASHWGGIRTGSEIKKGDPVFPRLEL